MHEFADPIEAILSIATLSQQDSDFEDFADMEEMLPPQELLLPMLCVWALEQTELESSELFEGFSILLHQSLQELRTNLRNHPEDSQQQWQILQKLILEQLQENTKTTFCHVMLDTIAECELPIPERLLTTAGQWLRAYYEDQQEQDHSLIESLDDADAFLHSTQLNDPYEFYQLQKVNLYYFPEESLGSVLDTFLSSTNPLIREGALLCLLHPRPAVSRALLTALQHEHLLKLVSKKSLNRLIMLRNWLSEDHAARLDSIIKKLRIIQMRHPESIENQPTTTIIKLLVSVTDGAGATSVTLVLKQAKEYSVTGCILKEAHGIIDHWQSPAMNKKEALSFLSNLRDHLPTTMQMDESFLQVVIPHFLALNKDSGEQIDPSFLSWLEQLEGKLWQPNRFNFQNWLIDQKPELEKINTNKSKQRLLRWIKKERDHLGWFENDNGSIERAGHILSGELPTDISKDNFSPFDYLLEPHRKKWQDRLTFIALLAKNKQQSKGLHWEDFALNALQLKSGLAISQIPLMSIIASETMEVASEILDAAIYEDEFNEAFDEFDPFYSG